MRGAKRLAFEAFDNGLRPSQVNIPRVKRTTLYRYYQEWKRLPGIVASGPEVAPRPLKSTLPVRRYDGAEQTNSLEAGFEQYQARQDFEYAKDQLRYRVQRLLESLAEAEERYRQGCVTVSDWERRRRRLDDQLSGFVLGVLAEINSQDELQSLAKVLGEIESGMSDLFREFKEATQKHEQLRRERELGFSCQLLSEKLNMPMVPTHVRRTIETTLLVRVEEEADVILRAVIGWAFNNRVISTPLTEQKKCWRSFVRRLKTGRWDFINELKIEYDRALRQVHVEYLFCPYCRATYRVSPVWAPYWCARCGVQLYMR